MELDPALISKYPFTSAATELLEEEGLTKEDLAYDPLLSSARRHALKRLLSAVEGSLYLEDIGLTPLEAIATYLIVRLVCARLDDPFLLRLVAEHESKRFYHLAREEPLSTLTWLASELGARTRPDGDHVWIDVAGYLRASTHLGGPTWRLANRDVRRGWVRVSRRELARLLQELLRIRLLRVSTVRQLPPPLEEIARTVAGRLGSRRAKAVPRRRSGEFPPCIEKLVAKAKRGENMSHHERFTLASYLLKVGWTPDQVVDLFRNAPDFKEKVTKYQVEHIAKRGYLPPNCSTLRAWGICGEDCGVKSPLSFRRRRRD